MKYLYVIVGFYWAAFGLYGPDGPPHAVLDLSEQLADYLVHAGGAFLMGSTLWTWHK